MIWAVSSGYAAALPKDWDPNRYVDVNEVRPGMEAYCLTCYSGTAVERFPLDVVSVIRDVEPGRDAILVQGKDERFMHTGVVAGCSGSPVYIGGRMAGALAFGWPFSKDPLYGVTPIKDMLAVGQGPRPIRMAGSGSLQPAGPAWDFSKPIDLAEVYAGIQAVRSATGVQADRSTASPCVLMVSGLSQQALAEAAQVFGPLGFDTLSAVGGMGRSDARTVDLMPGGAMLVPLISGDIQVAVVGTVTEVRDQRVYGFGHSFLGYGPVDLPLATGEIHTVVSNVMRSFKLGSSIQIVGSLTDDEPFGVVGRIGREARVLPVMIRVNHFATSSPLTFDCRLAYNKVLTADLLKACVSGAALARGAAPPEHTIRYRTSVRLQGGRKIEFGNVSSGTGLAELSAEMIGLTTLLMNNPFREVGIEAVDMDIGLEPRAGLSSVSSLEVSDVKIRPGQEVLVSVVLDSFLGRRRALEFSLEIPKDLADGEYTVTVCGPYEYQSWVRRFAPYRLTAYNTASLVEALDYALNLRRDRLYCLLELPPSGIAMERKELPELPATKAMFLQSGGRSMHVQPIQPWIEKSVLVDTVTAGKESVRIKVERTPAKDGR